VVILLVLNSGITISTWFRWSSSLKQYPPRILRMARPRYPIGVVAINKPKPLPARGLASTSIVLKPITNHFYPHGACFFFITLTSLLLVLKVIIFYRDNYNNNYGSKDSL
jgi:hypothetical protein